MYTGSMVGLGAEYFAVWGYVISHMRPDKEIGAQVEINPKLLSVMLGEPEEAIERVVKHFCLPDPKSRTPDEQGRKLVQMGPFDFRVVNGKKYIEIRDEEERRKANRDRQAKFREEHKKKEAGKRSAKSSPTAYESQAMKLEKADVPPEQIDKILDANFNNEGDGEFPG